jgi:pyrroline-5-carboxylate reductase
MAAVSATVWVEHESQMDTVTALSGSGPAYFFLFMEALEAAAHERGLPATSRIKLTWKRRSAPRKWRANPPIRSPCCASR